MVEYMERRMRDQDEPWSRIARHMIGLRNGEPGARRWRQVWSDHGLKGESARTVSRQERAALAPSFAGHDAELPAGAGRNLPRQRKRASMANRNTALDDELRAYLVAHSARETPAQAGIREATRSHPAAGMQIGPEQAQFLGLLVKLIGAHWAIEIGVFTGYSASAGAGAARDGRLLACDISDRYTGGRLVLGAGRPANRPATRSGARRSMRTPPAGQGTDFAFIDPSGPATTPTTGLRAPRRAG
jgi:hypothetical protein